MARTSQEDLDKMSFGKAFSTRRDELKGSGKTFTWRGNSYTTDLAEEAPRRRGRTGPATENAPERSSRPQRRPSAAPESSPRPTSRRSIGENIPRLASDFEKNNRRVERDPQDASPTTRAPARAPQRSFGRFDEDGRVEGSGRAARPGSLQRAIDSAPNATARSQAERIADEGMKRRMPLRSLINSVLESVDTRRQNADPSAATSRSERAAARARTRTQEAQAARERRSAGMAKGGMVKKGNTDRRKTGMFYDSKSPRGFK